MQEKRIIYFFSCRCRTPKFIQRCNTLLFCIQTLVLMYISFLFAVTKVKPARYRMHPQKSSTLLSDSPSFYWGELELRVFSIWQPAAFQECVNFGKLDYILRQVPAFCDLLVWHRTISKRKRQNINWEVDDNSTCIKKDRALIKCTILYMIYIYYTHTYTQRLLIGL